MEQDGQIDTTFDMEPEIDVIPRKATPVFLISNNMAHPPTTGGANSESARLAAMGLTLTPSKTHKARSSPAKSTRSPKGKK